jgi:hypothetical protein
MDLLKSLGELIPNGELILLGLAVLIAILLASSFVGLYIALGDALDKFWKKPVLSLILFFIFLTFILVGCFFIFNLVKGLIP